MHVIDLFDWGARNYPERLAFSGSGGDMSYREAQAATNRLARALLDDGFVPGTRFACLAPNCTPVIVAMLGAMRAGGAWCNVNLRAALEANIDVLRRGQCEVLFFHSSTADLVPAFMDSIPELRLALCLDSEETEYESMDSWSDKQSSEWLDHIIPSTALGIQGATGGTTGAPKLMQGSNDFVLMCTLGWATCWRFDTPPINVAITPVTHAAGLIVLAQFQFGGTTVFMDEPDLGELLNLIETRRVTTVLLPPTLIYMLLGHPRLDETDTSSLRYIVSTAAPIAPERLIEAVDRLGPVVCQSYGQSEAGFPVTWMSPTEMAEAAKDPAKRRLLLSCGRPSLISPSIEVMAEDGRLLPAGETGEIVLRGPTVMSGYLDDPDATAEVQAHGWHHTGDIGHRDTDGYVFITDRKRDMIVSGGFNLYPFEIEEVLLRHPAVQDCAAIGIPDEKWGEAVRAYVELKPDAVVDAEELITLCKSALGSMKAPKSIGFLTELPRSPAGKVLKRTLREPHWAGRERDVN